MGLQLIVNGDTLYGWIQFDLSASGDSIVIKDFAYNDVPGESIQTGQSVGLEKINLKDISIYGFNREVRISGSKGTATIFNLQGQQVHQSRLTGNNNISLDKGIYMVRVISDGRSVTKKVYLN